MKKVFLFLLFVSSLLLTACSNHKLKPPKKSPCACYDVIIDMAQPTNI